MRESEEERETPAPACMQQENILKKEGVLSNGIY